MQVNFQAMQPTNPLFGAKKRGSKSGNNGPANNRPDYRSSSHNQYPVGYVKQFKSGRWKKVVDKKADGGHRWEKTWEQPTEKSFAIKFSAIA